MTAQATSLPLTGQMDASTQETKLSLGARLLRAIMVAQQRRADREILHYSSIRNDLYRQEFGLELERRMLGQ